MRNAIKGQVTRPWAMSDRAEGMEAGKEARAAEQALRWEERGRGRKSR